MNKNVKRSVSMALSLIFLGTSLIGCGSKTSTSDNGATAAPSSSPTTVTYPIKTDVTLKYWMELHSNATSYAKNFGDLQIAKDLQQKTGIKVEYIHPATGQASEAFNILVASGDLPDIIEYRWTNNYPGGPNAAISNGIITKLNDSITKYSPNLQKLLKKYPDIDKGMKTDDGVYYFYPFLRGEPGSTELLSTAGGIVRKDWLDELSIPVPETIDDWYTMLKAFKEKKGVEIPLTGYADPNPANGSQITYLFDGAFGISNTFYIDGGKVKFGPGEKAYKDMLIFMAKLYKEGLLDKNFSTTDKKTMDANMLNGKSGATYGSGGSHVGTYMNTMKDKDPKYNVVGVKQPVLKKGEKLKYGNISPLLDPTVQAVITTKCKNVEIAARYLDYGYSEEGHLLYNFGTDGVSYNMVSGKPTYTDLIMKNPDKLSIPQAMTKYSRGNTNGPFVQDKGYIEQYYSLPQQKEALKAWSDQDKNSTQVPLITPTEAESSEAAKLQTEITTYVREMQYKFVMGKEPIENFDKYMEQLKKLNLEKLLQLKQQAYDRYSKR